MVCDEMLRKCLADGVIHVPLVLPLEWVARLAAATDVALASSPDEAEIYEGSRTAPLPYGELQAWKRLGAFREAVHEGSFALLAVGLMGSASARVYYDQMLVRELGSVRCTSWHQDIPYWKVAGDQICSIWLALVPIPGRAALEFLRGSRTWGEHNPQQFMDASAYAGTGFAALPDIESDRAAYDIVAHDIELGDALIFHGAIVHGVPPADQSGERAFPADETGLVHGGAYAGPEEMRQMRHKPMQQRHWLRWSLAAVLATGLPACAAAEAGGPSSVATEAGAVSPAQQVAALHDEMVAALRPFDGAVRGLLSDPVVILAPDTLEHAQNVAALGAGFRQRLETLPTVGLSEPDRLTRDYLVALARGMEDHPRFWLYSFPITPYAGGWKHNSYRQQAMGTPLASEEQRAHYLAALKAYPANIRSQADKLALQAERGIRIARPAIPGARRVAANLASTSSGFVPDDARLGAASPEEKAAYRAEVAALVETEIAPAFTALGAVLDDDYVAAAPELPGLMWQKGGAEHYARLARLHTGTDLSPQEIHAIGRQILRDARAELVQIKQSVGFTGSDREFAALVDADPQFAAATPQDVEAHFRRAMERIEPVLPRYFSLLPKAPYDVERAPRNIEEGMTFGFYRAPAPGNPVGAYLYNGSATATTSYANAAALIYHELLPGHHFQIALQLENKDLPLLRRGNSFTYLNAYVEGWAEYAADLADEMGMYASPYERFGRLYSKMFLANRLVVDTGLNALGWTHEEARAFMKANTFASDAEVESELLRYSTDIPGQALSYAMGQRELLRMRDEARAALGERFSFPAFHAAVLSPGAVPMDLLDAHLKRWQAE